MIMEEKTDWFKYLDEHFDEILAKLKKWLYV